MLVDDGTEGLSYKVIGMAIGVHKKYGPGLLEKAYLRPLVMDLRAAGHDVDCQPRLLWYMPASPSAVPIGPTR